MEKIVNTKFICSTRNQKGQALFELIIFLPFLIFLYSIYYTVGSSISASINQQKAVRGYFYALTKGNSYINTLPELEELSNENIKMVGFSSVGWREKSNNGKDAFAPCFTFSSILKNDEAEDCFSSDREEDSKTRNIRVFTFYGVCGPVYSETSEPNGKFFEIIPSMQMHPFSCALADDPPS